MKKENWFKRSFEQTRANRQQESEQISYRDIYEKQKEKFEELRNKILSLVEKHNNNEALRELKTVRHLGEFYDDEQQYIEFNVYWANDEGSHGPSGFIFYLEDGVFKNYDGSTLTSDFDEAYQIFKDRIEAIPTKDEPA